MSGRDARGPNDHKVIHHLFAVASFCSSPSERQPHRLDVTCDARKQVAFGGGIHHCLGAVLARMEGAIAFKALLEAFPTMELAAPPTRRPTFTLRGLEMLLITL